jgi:hypothetical protein
MWTDPAETLPADGASVWIRLKLYSIQTPLPAIYVSASHSFTVPNGLQLDWTFVARWKLQ